MLSDKALRDAKPGLIRDKLPGFYAIKGKTRVSFFVQRDIRQNGRRVGTKKERIGVFGPTMSVADARKIAKRKLSDLETLAQPGRTTLRQAWQRYRDRHLLRKGRGERTVEWYRDQIERCWADRLDDALAEIGADREALASRHEGMADGDSNRVAADQAMIAFRAVYRHAADMDPALPVLPRFSFLFRPKTTKSGVKDQAWWWATLESDEFPEVRRCFHALCLLTGGRAGAMKVARWEHLNVKGRRWHVPKPKGGEGRAFDMPLSLPIVQWLRRAREAAKAELAAADREDRARMRGYIFPASSKVGHLASQDLTARQQREMPEFKVGHGLRRTYESYADGHATALEVKLLMNHTLKDDVTHGYTDRDIVWPRLLAAQSRISRALTMQATASSSKRVR